LRVRVHHSLAAVDARAWNSLGGDRNPTLSYEFLRALERNGCVGERHGWLPRIFAAYTDDDTLIGAAPAYIKDNSYGEFVFDWSWADAYQQHGLHYYPKLVVAVPFTPATGQRLLIANDRNFDEIALALQRSVLAYCRAQELTGMHWLFPTGGETDWLERQGLLRRMGCQYHWHNDGYTDFDDFLARFNSRKRKKANRERRRVAEQGVTLSVHHGCDLDEFEWRMVHDFYLATYERKWGFPTLNLGFFQELGRTMGERVVVVFARHAGETVASALMLHGSDTLYGRVWGCREHFHSLHFEACYYQGIDYCIANGIARFEPGAQGEHKIARGFRPTPTWSAHWLSQPQFHDAIARYLKQEVSLMRAQCHDLNDLLPFRTDA
jgi:predicted N-acyltransferase